MKHISILALTAFCTASLLTGCKGKDGEAAPALSGKIVGFATPYDEAGNSVAKAGTTVSVENQNLTATTDADGRFELGNLKAGTYNVVYTRAGYGTFKRFSIPHVGGEQPTYLGGVGLSAMSTATVSSFSISPSTGGSYPSIPYRITLNGATASGARVIMYISSQTSVSSANYAFSYGTGNSGSSTLFGSIDRSYFSGSNLASGSTAYAIAYPSSYYSSSYTDPATGRSVNPSLGAPSSVQTFIVP